MKKFYILLLVLSFFTINCDSKKENKENITKSCKEVVELVEDCMSLHRGALGYINSCGELETKDINSFSTCEQVLEYVKGK